MLVSEVYPVNLRNGHLFGVEVEMEFNDKLPHYRLVHWTEVKEGSLRNGVEWITAPLSYKSSKIAIQELFSRLNKNNQKIKSTRTSTHVHCNVSDFTFQQVGLYSCVFSLVEDTIKQALAPSREHSNFCYSSLKAYNWLNDVELMLHGQAIHLNDENRYVGLNYNSMKKHGTVEGRVFECPDTEEDVINCVYLMYCIRKYVCKHTLQDFVKLTNSCKDGDISNVIIKVFGSKRIPKLLHWTKQPGSLYRINSFVNKVSIDVAKNKPIIGNFKQKAVHPKVIMMGDVVQVNNAHWAGGGVIGGKAIKGGDQPFAHIDYNHFIKQLNDVDPGRVDPIPIVHQAQDNYQEYIDKLLKALN